MSLKTVLAPHHPAHLALGLTLWFAWFNLLYGGLSLSCRHGGETLAPALIVAATLIATTLFLLLARRCWRGRGDSEPRHFVASVGAGLYAAAALATLAVGLPALWLPACL